MRRLFVSMVLAGVLALTVVGSAFAHVHGITPLGGGCLSPSVNAGGARTDATPANGVLGGSFPADPGQSGLTPGGATGGNDAAACDTPAAD
ncbi:MAG: hypothetical protein H0X16_09180 [Chloroflexi bacterium]|nr:hypothetical protein [Chloroflexota bacterium]